jgi:hypothetical protein
MKKDETRKKVNKIYGQIKKVAIKGKDYSLEYHRLIDQIVEKGDYAYLEMCLSDFYDIEVAKYGSVYNVKSKTWKLVLEQTDSSLISKLRSLYKTNKIYQVGQEIRSESASYVDMEWAGPYLAEDVTIKRNSSTSVTRTKYSPQSATMSQLEIVKHVSENQSNIQLSLLDEGIYKIDVYKVIWATFSSPLYSVPTSMTQSQSLDSDLLVVRMRELDSFGYRAGGIISTSSIRISDIYDSRTKSSFIGKSIGDRLEFDPRKIYRTDSETSSMLGIEERDLYSVSTRFEAEILQIKRIEMVSFASPYEISRISTIQPSGTQSALSVGTTYSTGIPTTHGSDYLITTHRRGDSGWIYEDLRYEAYSYKVSIRLDNLLGTIKEVDSIIDNPSYFQIKSRYATYLGLKKTFLEVQKAGAATPITVIYENYGQSEESNLFARYKIAIDYLNS